MRELEDEIYEICQISNEIVHAMLEFELVGPSQIKLLKIINNSLYFIFVETKKMILTEFEKYI